MQLFSKEIQCFFDKNSNQGLRLGDQNIDYCAFEKKKSELIEYSICYSILEYLKQIDSRYSRDFIELETKYINDESIYDFIDVILKYLKEENLELSNVTVHLTAQKPRLCRPDLNLNYKFNIRDYLCRIFKLSKDNLVVQAGTGEKIGNTGNEKSIIIISNISINEINTSEKKFIGFGYDRHRFENDLTKPEKKLTICGQKINYSKSITAHSDGDMVLHALVNAIFSNIGLGDIGEHFPDTDPEWKNADSTKFVSYTMNQFYKNRLKIENIEIILITSEILNRFLETNYQNFIPECIKLISKLCKTNEKHISFKIRLADNNLQNKDELCIQNDEGIDANIRIISSKKD
jgi:2-C-methyl-D-erythritol 2,4-cyclodiphosphate synthase